MSSSGRREGLHSLMATLVRDGNFSRNNRPRPWQAAQPREVTKNRKNRQEHDELDRVARSRARNHLPHQPQRRLCPAHRPHGSVEVATLMALTFRRRLDAWQLAEQTEQQDETCHREVRVLVDLLQVPVPSHDREDEAGDIQHGERNHFTPGECVADAAIQRIGTILREPDDVRLRLDSREPAAQSGDAGPNQHRAEPQRHPRVETVLEQVERQRPGRDEENENPDRPVVEPVIKLVAFANLALRCVLDGNLGHELLRFSWVDVFGDFDVFGAFRGDAGRRVYPGDAPDAVVLQMPFSRRCASASASLSSAKRAVEGRAVTRASPSRTSTVFTHTPSPVMTYEARRRRASVLSASLSSRIHRCNTRPISLSLASFASGVAALMPSSWTRPNWSTSMVSPSITTRTRTDSDRSTGGDKSVAADATSTVRIVRRKGIAISLDNQLREPRTPTAMRSPRFVDFAIDLRERRWHR